MDATAKAVKAHRARLKKRGLKRIEICVPAREAAVIRRAAAVLRERSGETARLRHVLGFSREAGRAANALDLFSMTVPLSTEGKLLWDEALEAVQRNRKDRALSRPRKVAL
ncbi:MAG: hypothetical protein WBD53_19740 [Xanthobacteraceae bacterium]